MKSDPVPRPKVLSYADACALPDETVLYSKAAFQKVLNEAVAGKPLEPIRRVFDPAYLKTQNLMNLPLGFVQAQPALDYLSAQIKKGEDSINPSHYREHPSGVECITITEHMDFCLGNALKYIWRAGLKTSDATEDLEKAKWYIERKLARLKREEPNG